MVSKKIILCLGLLLLLASCDPSSQEIFFTPQKQQQTH